MNAIAGFLPVGPDESLGWTIRIDGVLYSYCAVRLGRSEARFAVWDRVRIESFRGEFRGRRRVGRALAV